MSKKLTMSEMGLDDELNFPDMNFDSPEVKDDRSATTKVLDGAWSGAKSTLKNPSFLSTLIRRSLPKEYGEAADAVQSTSNTVRETYDEATTIIKPAAAELARSVEKMVPESAKRTKALMQKIGQWDQSSARNTGPNAEQQRMTNIGLELDALFSARQEEQKKEAVMEDSRSKVQQGLELVRHRDSMTALNAISLDLSSLNQYNAKINARFQRKSLELQYRSYYTQVDMLTESRRQSEMLKARLDAISKNTGLPDYVKLRNSERLGETLRNQFMDSVVGGLTGGRSDFIKKFVGGMKQKVVEAAQGAAGAMQMGAMGVDMYQMQDELDSMDGSATKGALEKGAGMGAGWLINKRMHQFGAKMREKAEKNETISKGAAVLGDLAGNGAERLNEFRLGREKEGEFGGNKFLRGFLDFFWPNMGVKNDLQQDQLNKGREAAVFNNFTNKSINEIIPGYLARILREINVFRTGDDSAKLMEYDFTNNKFVGGADYLKSVTDKLTPESRKQSISKDIESKLSEIEEAAGEEMTQTERQKLGEFMMASALKMRGATAERMGNAGTFSSLQLGDEGAEKLARMFRSYLEVDDDGQMADTAAAKRRESSLIAWQRKLPEAIENQTAYIQDLINAGQLEILRQTGLLNENDDLDVDKFAKGYVDVQGGAEERPGINLKKRTPEEIKALAETPTAEKVQEAMDSKITAPRKVRAPVAKGPGTRGRAKGPKSTQQLYDEQGRPIGRSDYFLKENIKKLDPKAALGAIKDMAVSAWNYKPGSVADDGGEQHVGPMAQDVQKALGDDFAPGGKKIDLVNMNGLTMQAIKDVDAKLENQPIVPLTQMIIEKLKFSNEKLASIESLTASQAGVQYVDGKPEDQTSRIRAAFDKMRGAGKDRKDMTMGEKFMSMLGLGGSIAGDVGSGALNVADSIHASGTRHAKKAFTHAQWLGGKVSAGAERLGQMAVDRWKGITDIYVGLGKHPRITKAKLQAGEYFDEKTGEVIKSFHDIKGTIIDADGNIIISAEELKDAFMRTTIVGKTVKLSQWIGNKFLDAVDAGNERLGILGRGAKNILRSGLEFAGDVLDVPRDVYVKGEAKPRLIAILMKGGQYVNEDGKPIRRPSDIKGPIKDAKTNRYLITEEDLKKGLVDEKGDKLQTPLAKLVGLGAAGVAKVFDVFKNIHQHGMDAVKGLVGVGKDAWAGVMNALSHGLGFGKALPVLEQIRDILDKRLPAMKKQVRGDADGDGKRDNGWESKQQKLEDAKNAFAENAKGKDKAEAKHYATRNTIDMMIEKAQDAKKGVMGMLGMGEDGGGGVDIDIDGKDDKRKGGKNRKLSKAQRRAEAMKRMEDAAKQKARAEKIAKAKDFAKRIPGAGAIGRGASAVGNAAAKLPGAGMVGAAASKLPSLATIGTGAAAAGTAAGAMGRNAMTTLGKPYGGLRLAGQGLWGGAKLAGKGAMGLGKGALWAGSKLGALGGLGMRALPGLGLGYGLYSGYNDIKDGNYGSAAMNLGLAGLSGATMLGGLGAAGALATGVLGAIFSPVVLGAAAIGAAGYAGYKLYKWATKKKFDELNLLRMVQYGMLQGDAEQHQQVGALEDLLMPLVSYDNGNASIEEKAIDQKKILEIFDYSEADQDGKERLAAWISSRFKPVFLTHLTAAKKLGIEGGIQGSDKAPVALKSKMLSLVAMPEGPYGFGTGPFKEHSRLAAGPQTVQAVVDALRAKYSKEEKEDAAKGKDPLKEEAKMTAALAATAKMNLGDGKINSKLPTQAEQQADQQTQRQNQVIEQAVKKVGPAGLTVVAASEGGRAMATVTSDPGEKYMGGNVSALEAIRMKAYGLTEMDSQRVIAMRYMESLVNSEIKVGADFSATWTGNLVDVIKKARKFFIMGSSDEGQTETWTQWFLKRFLPTYTTYLGSLFMLTFKNKQESAEAVLTANKSLLIAGKLIALSAVWRTAACPWKDYAMCMDTKATDPNIDFLKDAAKAEKLAEEKGSKQGATPAPLPANKFPASAKEDFRRQERAAEDARKTAESVGDSGGGDEAEEPVAGGSSTISFSNAGSLQPSMAAGGLSNGSGADQYLKIDKGESLEGVNAEFLRLFRGAVQEYGEKTGKSVLVGAGKRTYEMQAALHKKDKNKAAAPGTSLHEVGLAIDASSQTLNEMDKLGLLKKYGLTRPIGKEPWHLEAAGIQNDIAGNRADPGKANAAITAGVGKGGGGWGTVDFAKKYTRNPEMAKKLLNASSEPNVAEQKPGSVPAPAAVAQPTPKTETPVVQTAQVGEPEPKGGTGGGGGAGGTDPNQSYPAKPGISNGPKTGDAAQALKDTVPGSANGYQRMAPGGQGKGWNAMKGVITDGATLAGIDPRDAATVAAIESGFNPNAKAQDSSATGLFQFTAETWSSMMKMYGKQYNIPPDTSPTDPKANALMGALLMRDNKKAIAGVRANPNSTDVYMAHFLGAPNAKKFFALADDAIPAQSMPKQAASNKSIFYANGRPRTKAEIYALMNKKVSTALSKHGVQMDGETPPTDTQMAQTDAAIGKAQAKGNTSPTSGFMQTAFSPDASQPAIVPLPQEPARATRPAAEVLSSVLPKAPAPRTQPVQQTDDKRDALFSSISSISNILTEQLTVQRGMLTELQAMRGDITEAGKQKAPPTTQSTAPDPKTSGPRDITSYKPNREPVPMSRPPVNMQHQRQT